MRPKGQIFELKRLRDDLGITQRAIAEATGKTTSFLSAIEHGRRSAPKPFLDRLRELYEINPEDYLCDYHEYQAKHSKDDVPQGDGLKYIQIALKNAVMINNSGDHQGAMKTVAELLNKIQDGAEKSDVSVSVEQPSAQAANISQDAMVQQLMTMLQNSQNSEREARAELREVRQELKELQAKLSQNEEVSKKKK